MPCTDELPVRFAETDAQGHTFFANYRTFCDEALTYGLSATGCDYTTMEAEEGVVFVCRDRTLFADRPRIEVTPERVHGPSGALAAEARLVSAGLDPRTHETKPQPACLRSAIAAHSGTS